LNIEKYAYLLLQMTQMNLQTVMREGADLFGETYVWLVRIELRQHVLIL